MNSNVNLFAHLELTSRKEWKIKWQTCSVLCAARSFTATPSQYDWLKTLTEAVRSSLSSPRTNNKGTEVKMAIIGSLRIDDFCTTTPLDDCAWPSGHLPASRQSRRRWWERFAGVLETAGREVIFQSFLSILQVFLPDISSITLATCS